MLFYLPADEASKLAAFSPAKIINQPPGRAQIVLPVNFYRAIVKGRMQRIDVHSRRERFRKPLFQARAKSPSQIVGGSLKKSSIAWRQNHYSRDSRGSAQDADRSHKTVSPVRIENRPAQKSQNAVGLARAKNVGRS